MAIKEHDARRIRRLEGMLEDRRRKLSDHENGHRRLTSEEHELTTRQLQMYGWKIENLRDESDEDKLEKIMESRQMFQEMQNIDYLDFGKTGLSN